MTEKRSRLMAANSVSCCPPPATVRCLLLVVVVVVVVATTGGAKGAQAESSGKSNDVCSTSSKPNELPVFSSPAQVRSLVAQYESDRLGGACPEEYAGAFEALKQVLDEQVVLGDICSKEAYERIRNFHTKFMHYYVPELSREQLAALKSASGKQHTAELKPIPPALARFFITYVKQVTAACKQQLVARMKAEVLEDKQLVDDEDMAVIQQYQRESRRLGFLYEFTKMGLSSYGRKKKNDLNSLEIVDLLQVAAHGPHGDVKTGASSSEMGGAGGVGSGAVIDGLDIDDGTKLYVQVRFDDRLRRIKEACLKRFMPVYQELFLPVIRLNNLGYIDHTHTKLEDKELRENEQLHKWLDIIQTCEVLKDVEVLHDSSAMQAIVGIIQDNSHLAALAAANGVSGAEKQVAASASRPQIKILSRAEANALEAKVEAAAREASGEGDLRPLYDPQQVHMAHVPVAFTPRLWLTEPARCQHEVDAFHKDLARAIKHKTSHLRAWAQDLRFTLKNALHVGKNQIADRDQSAALGRIAAFADRHRNLIKGVGVVISIIVISTIVSG